MRGGYARTPVCHWLQNPSLRSISLRSCLINKTHSRFSERSTWKSHVALAHAGRCPRKVSSTSTSWTNAVALDRPSTLSPSRWFVFQHWLEWFILTLRWGVPRIPRKARFDTEPDQRAADEAQDSRHGKNPINAGREPVMPGDFELSANRLWQNAIARGERVLHGVPPTPGHSPDLLHWQAQRGESAEVLRARGAQKDRDKN